MVALVSISEISVRFCRQSRGRHPVHSQRAFDVVRSTLRSFIDLEVALVEIDSWEVVPGVVNAAFYADCVPSASDLSASGEGCDRYIDRLRLVDDRACGVDHWLTIDERPVLTGVRSPRTIRSYRDCPGEDRVLASEHHDAGQRERRRDRPFPVDGASPIVVGGPRCRDRSVSGALSDIHDHCRNP